jgi:hypothetical protein
VQYLEKKFILKIKMLENRALRIFIIHSFSEIICFLGRIIMNRFTYDVYNDNKKEIIIW